jgi:hypothetical protein
MPKLKKDLIYKYMPFSANTLKLLIKGEFWLGFPKNLNDPFEAEFLVKQTNYLPTKNLLVFMYNLHKDLFKHVTLDEKLKEIDIDKTVFHRDLHELARYILREQCGVTSFSYVNDETLMWAHYADSQKGICLIFDKQAMWESILKYGKNLVLRDVQYCNKLVEAELIINDYGYSFANTDKILLTKLTPWKREKELRLFQVFLTLPAKRNLKFDKSCIKGIIFGENAADDDKETIRQLVRNDHNYKDVLFYQANKDFKRNKMKSIKE